MIRTRLFRISPAVTLSVLVAAGLPQLVQAQATRIAIDDKAGSRDVLPLSTTVSASMRKKIIKRPRTSVIWEDKEYGIDDGIDVLMSVIANPTTDVATRATAINRLGHFSTCLQNRECLPKLCALFDGLGSRMEKRQILTCLTIAQDSTGLSLLYRVATNESDPVLRFHGASGLAAWNIREGVHQLIELFPSRAETGLRQVGAAAMISFTSLNERKGWNCPQDEIRRAALATAGDNSEEYAKAAMHGYRAWFEENKHRFPEWKLGDPLPEASQDASNDCVEK